MPARLPGLLAWAHLPQPCPAPSPSVQAQFLASYQQRASALAAEVDSLKHAHRDAHKACKAGEARVARLRAALAEQQARKEASGG